MPSQRAWSWRGSAEDGGSMGQQGGGWKVKATAANFEARQWQSEA